MSRVQTRCRKIVISAFFTQGWALAEYIAEVSISEDDGRVISNFKEFDTKDWLSVQFQFGLFQVSQKKTT